MKYGLLLLLVMLALPSFANAAKLPSATIDDNETVFVADAAGDSDKPMWEATICAQGTFGSGTVALYQSADAGTTKTIAITDLTSVAVTATANKCFGQVTFSKGYPPIKVYATMTGATNPSVSIYVFDNNRQ